MSTRAFDTRLAYIAVKRQWRLQVTNRTTGETVDTFYRQFKDANLARFGLTTVGTDPAGVSSGPQQ